MHRKDVYRYGNYIEYEYKFVGRYGAKGEKRAPRRKVTPEQMKKQNQRNRERTCLRLMRANFFPDDLWVTLKFPKGTRKSIDEVKKIRRDFFEALRRNYKKRKQELKFIYRIEIGERGGIHFHFVVNRLEGGGPGADELIRALWLKYGTVHFAPMYEEGGFKALAEYLVKPVPDDVITGQLTLFGEEEEAKIFCRYGRSRNLLVPEPEEHVYTRRTVRKLVEEGPKPTPGYYIDRDSVVSGVNPYTGMSYLRYVEIRLDPLTRKQIREMERERRGSG